MFDWSHKLVLVRSDPRLFGKVVKDDGSYIDVEFFKSVADRETHRYPKKSATWCMLPFRCRLVSLWKYPQDFGESDV